MTSVVLKVTRISLCVWVCSENMSWLFCFEQWQLGDVLCFLSDRDRQVNRSCLELGAVFFFLVSSWIDFWFEQSCSCQIQAEALQPIGALRFFLYYFLVSNYEQCYYYVPIAHWNVCMFNLTFCCLLATGSSPTVSMMHEVSYMLWKSGQYQQLPYWNSHT